MKIIFMGTPQFAVPSLQSLADSGHQIAAVVTRIDKPAGRGRSPVQPAVKQAALARGLRVLQPKRIRDQQSIESLRAINHDVIVVAAYGQILPKEVLTLPKYGCVNVHASLLPAHRGAAPINWAIIRGDAETGVTIMQMDEGMDTGGILMQESIPIGPSDTAGTLAGKLSVLGSRLIVRALPLIESGALEPVLQDNSKATAAPPLRKEDGLIDWRLPAVEIRNRVRGFNPWPGAYTFLEGKLIKILECEVVPGSMEPGALSATGTVMDAGTGRDLLRVVTLQAAGKKPLPASDFLRGHRGLNGKQFDKS